MKDEDDAVSDARADDTALEPAPGSGDLIALLLADKRSENTRRAYRGDLTDFFRTCFGADPSPERVQELFSMGADRLAFTLALYKGDLIARGLSESSVNRRLSAVQSLLRFGRRIGATDADIAGIVSGEKVVSYRDTSGVTPDQARALLGQPDRSTLKGLRDYAILRLLLENALRSAEVRSLRVRDFDGDAQALSILGKGRGTQRERVTVNAGTVRAIEAYVEAAGHGKRPDTPLFLSADPRGAERPLTGDGLYKVLREYAEKAGIPKRVSPHRMRHTAITAALEATGGDVVTVQHLSRHARVETVMRYNDNREGRQARATALLGALFEGDAPADGPARSASDAEAV